jgi:hypothetical protein
MRVDQVEREATEEELPDEAGMLPFRFARGLCDIARFLLGGERLGIIGHVESRLKVTSGGNSRPANS